MFARLARLFRPTPPVPPPEPALPSAAYAARLAREIESYREVENIHALPAIYDRWFHLDLAPKLRHVFGSDHIEGLLLQPLIDRAGEIAPGETLRVASLGSGEGSLERWMSDRLAERHIPHRFDCFEVNPHLVARAEAEHGERGDRLAYVTADLNEWLPDGPYHAAFANHSLHHVVELEHLFAAVRRALGDSGVFVINDMIGRNGHMRWPETLAHVERIWKSLPRRYKYNHQLQAWHDEFFNIDCSGEGFEGIRAQDILPLLLESFGFERFLGFGGIVDPFIDRGYGHNFDPAIPDDLALLGDLVALNDSELAAGRIKPTMMIGVARVVPRQPERFWPPLSARASVRDPRA